MNHTWKERARRELFDRRGHLPAWGYQPGRSLSVEPTALACLGLLSSGGDRPSPEGRELCRASAGWLAALQQAEGSLPVSPGLTTPGWSTPYALLVWKALGGYEASRGRAIGWLRSVEGRALPHTASSRAVFGHDPTLVGWPWVTGTHSWLEPTAMSVLALSREGLGDNPRVRQGVDLILDRAIHAGGWNYGNKSVFGRELRPQPAPTGLALMALAARGVRSPIVTRAIRYLHRALPEIRSAVSLGWGLLGLRAHGECPEQADAWLAEAFEQLSGTPQATVGLALLLLAAGDRAMNLLVSSA